MLQKKNSKRDSILLWSQRILKCHNFLFLVIFKIEKTLWLHSLSKLIGKVFFLWSFLVQFLGVFFNNRKERKHLIWILYYYKLWYLKLPLSLFWIQKSQFNITLKPDMGYTRSKICKICMFVAVNIPYFQMSIVTKVFIESLEKICGTRHRLWNSRSAIILKYLINCWNSEKPKTVILLLISIFQDPLMIRKSRLAS